MVPFKVLLDDGEAVIVVELVKTIRAKTAPRFAS